MNLSSNPSTRSNTSKSDDKLTETKVSILKLALRKEPEVQNLARLLMNEIKFKS